MPTLITSIEGPSGNVYRKERTSEGEIVRRNAKNNYFISERAWENIRQKPNTTTLVKPRDRVQRQNAIKDEFPEWDSVEGRNPGSIKSSDSRRETSIKAWMRNEELKKRVSNEPLLEGKDEQRQAREALAIQMANELEGVESERKRIGILRKYGIY